MKTNPIDLDHKIQEVKELMHGLRDLRMFKRYQCILMYLKGRKYAEIADVIGCTEQTVYNYVRDYKANGFKGTTSLNIITQVSHRKNLVLALNDIVPTTFNYVP